MQGLFVWLLVLGLVADGFLAVPVRAQTVADLKYIAARFGLMAVQGADRFIDGKINSLDFEKVIVQMLAGDITPTATPTGGQQEVVLVGAGDIADNANKDEATARLLDGLPNATVFTAGDNAYPDGTAANFVNFYNPTWGRHKVRTRPSPGNHDYHTAGAAAYYSYFGSNAGQAGRGYYSYDLGAWHIVSLNSELPSATQEQWLTADLAASNKVCTLAYWHHPVFSSGQHGNSTRFKAMYQILYDHKADVVLNGHDHLYERFGLQNANGQADSRGIRQFTVGTGGADLYPFSNIRANSEVRNNTTHGVLKLTLRSGSYSWVFIPVAGKTFGDSGSDTCVN